jgi:hypothetical protein
MASGWIGHRLTYGRIPVDTHLNELLQGVALDMRAVPQSTRMEAASLEKRGWRNIKSFAQFLDVGFVEVTFLMQDFGYDAFGAKDWNQVFLAQIIRIHQSADFDRRSIRNGMMLFLRMRRLGSSRLWHISLLQSLDYLCLPVCPRRLGTVHVDARM